MNALSELKQFPLVGIDPNLLASVQPRRILPPHGFPNPALRTPEYLGFLTQKNLGPFIEPTLQILRLLTPAYFVFDDFANACGNTRLPDMPLSDINLPMEAFTLIFSLYFTRSIPLYVPFLNVARNQSEIILFGNAYWDRGDDSAVLPFMTKARLDVGLHIFLHVPNTKFFVTNRAGSGACKVGDEVLELLKSHSLLYFHLAISVCLALSARPELIAAGPLVRPQKIKRGKVALDALWGPTTIGKDYRIMHDRDHQLEKDEPTLRMHWRRGHYRQQPFGFGRAKQKVIWIEPILVNAPD